METQHWVLEKNIKDTEELGYVNTGKKKGMGDQAIYLMELDEKKYKEARAKVEKAKREQEKKEKQAQIDKLRKQIEGLQDQLDNLDDEDKKKKK